MIKKNLKLLLITSAVILLPILAGLIMWDHLPDLIPIHWNISGEIDGWSSKPLAVLGMPLFLLALQWVAVLTTATDPKKHNHSGKILHFVFWIIPVLSIVLSTFTYSAAIGKTIPVGMLVSLLLGLLFVIIGNYLPKCQQNYTIGIRLPWTLHSEENWNKTHRLSGWIWVIGGIGVMIAGIFDFIWLTVSLFLMICLVPLIYSYILHRKGI